MRVRLDGENPYGVTEVTTEDGETPLDAYHIAAALGSEHLTEENLEALERVYGEEPRTPVCPNCVEPLDAQPERMAYECLDCGETYLYEDIHDE